MNMNERSIFAAALDITDRAERAAYLDSVCADNAELRQRLDQLLAAQEQMGDFLAQPVLAPTVEAVVTEGPGTRVGPYKLLQQIGEGGMGVVYMAEQQEPIRRKVALKIIKPGMDSHQVIARFEAERQALAMMDHVNIAKVLDAGTTPTGRPYFVMELVHGMPITKYCDDNKLTPRQRLELFVQVCQAIQHAHQKGIIHRDIKPSNVLVTMYDDRPVPKVIDFGVAKAIEQRLTEKTLFTQFGGAIGTFEYMSPEQAELNAFGVDTRSDIYSLGVLLYELLTGTTPLERARLREAAYGEIVRLIKEEEPIRPSQRLSSSGEALSAISQQRATDPTKIADLVRGELDWLVLKCLEKDRSRRYETASGLARDVERYLKDEPVEACPPTLAYRLAKTYRKNRTAILLASTIAAVMLFATGVSLAFGLLAQQAAIAAAESEGRAKEKERQAEQDRDEAQRARERLRRILYASRANFIQTAWNADDVYRVKRLLEEQRPGPGETDLRGFEWYYMNRLCHSEIRTLQPEPLKGSERFVAPNERPYSGLSLGPDGAWLAVFGRDPKEKRINRITVYELQEGREVWTKAVPPSGNHATVVGWSRDGNRLLTRLRDDRSQERLIVFDKETRPVILQDAGNFLAFSPDGSMVATWVPQQPGDPSNSGLRISEAESGKVRFKVSGKGGERWHFSSDGKQLHWFEQTETRTPGLGFVEMTQITLDTTTGEKVSLRTAESFLQPQPKRSSTLVYSPDGTMLARKVHYSRTIEVWSTTFGNLLWTGSLPLSGASDSPPVFSPDSKLLAVNTGSDGTIRVWETTQQVSHLGPEEPSSPLYTFKDVSGCEGLAFNAAGNRLIALEVDGVIKEWEVKSPPPPVDLTEQPDPLVHPLFGPGVFLGLGGLGDNGIRRHNNLELLAAQIVTSSGMPQLLAVKRFADALAWHRMTSVMSCDRNPPVLAAQFIASFTMSPTLSGLPQLIAAKRLGVTWSSENGWIWGNELPEWLLIFPLLDPNRVGTRFDDCKFRVMYSSRGEELKIVDAADPEKVLLTQKLNKVPADIQIPQEIVFRAGIFCELSSDGRHFFLWRVGEPIRSWDTSDFKERLHIPALEHPYDTVTFDRTMRRLAIRRTLLPSGNPLPSGRPLGEGNAVLELWDTQSGRRLLVASGPSARSSARLVFSPDGSKVAAILDGRIRLWNAEDGTELPAGGSVGEHNWCVPDNSGKKVATFWEGITAHHNFGPGAQQLQQGPKKFDVSIRDAQEGRILCHLPEPHRIPIQGVAFSPDGKRIATIAGSTDHVSNRWVGDVRLWDTETGAELLSLQSAYVPEDPAGIWFSPSGNTLHIALPQDMGLAGQWVPANLRGETETWDATPRPEAKQP